MQASNRPSFDVAVTKDVLYGHNLVDYNGGEGPFKQRALALDVYAPVTSDTALPALLLAFGGAFHRGSRSDDVRADVTPCNTNIVEYARRFASRGYVCFSIDYRLTQEDPHPGFTPTLGPEPVPTSRIDVVRRELGLPPATSDMLKWAQEAAIDDVAAAFRFVVAEAPRFNVDPSRVAIGGYSAGGRIAVTAALAESISPVAVVALSGVAATSAVDAFHASGRRKMPIFLAYGEHDLDYVVPGAKALAGRLERAAHPYECHLLPGQTHFYPSTSVLSAAEDSGMTLQQAMQRFLDQHL